MLTVGMNYKIIPGKEKSFESAFRGVVKAMNEIEEHKKTNLYADIDDKASYLIVSEWDSKDAFNAFIGSEKFKKVTDWGAEKILAGRPSHNLYEK